MRNNLLLIIMTLTVAIIFAQKNGLEPILHFEYDAAGNQIVRCTICPSRSANENLEEIVSKVSLENEENILNNAFEYFPNPVKNELKITWSNTNVLTISVFDITSKFLASYTIDKNLVNYNVPFGNYSNGTYVVKILFVNGKQETFKIIKI